MGDTVTFREHWAVLVSVAGVGIIALGLLLAYLFRRLR